MDSLRMCLALGPLALYLAALAVLNLGRRPTVVSGARDLAALGIGVAGLVIIGPIELFFPQVGRSPMAPYVWLVLLAMYGLTVSLAVLLGRPRTTIYNIEPAAFRPVFARVIDELDPGARWAGSSLVLPALGIELRVEAHPWMRNISLTALADLPELSAWRQLEHQLPAHLAGVRSRGGVVGVALLAAALAMLSVVAWQLTAHPAEIAQEFREMLRIES